MGDVRELKPKQVPPPPPIYRESTPAVAVDQFGLTVLSPGVVSLTAIQAHSALSNGQMTAAQNCVASMRVADPVLLQLHNSLGQHLGDGPAKALLHAAEEVARQKAFIESIAKGDTAAAVLAIEFLAPKMDPEPPVAPET